MRRFLNANAPLAFDLFAKNMFNKMYLFFFQHFYTRENSALGILILSIQFEKFSLI